MGQALIVVTEQTLRDRHNLLWGTNDQKLLVLAGLVSVPPLSDVYPRLSQVIGTAATASDIKGALLRLARCVGGPSTRAPTDVSSLGAIDNGLRTLMHSLAAPGLSSLAQRLDAIERTKSSLLRWRSIESGRTFQPPGRRC